MTSDPHSETNAEPSEPNLNPNVTDEPSLPENLRATVQIEDDEDDAEDEDEEELRSTFEREIEADSEADARPQSPTPGRRLALGTGALIPGTPYRVQRWLGDGGMGAVFEAQHIDTERKVAVKILHTGNLSRWAVQAFRNEARTSARIDSPNIVDIYDFKALEHGRLLIVMEFLKGPNLREASVDEPLSMARIIAVGRQICRGLSAAHLAGIVHRDIKPENVMLIEREGRPDFVKLVDFGVAQFMSDGGRSHAAGTAEFMAPEARRGEADARADIYSFGCLLYEVSTGNLVFSGASLETLAVRHQQEEPVAPSITAPQRSIPPGFDALVLRCLCKRPADRYQNMDEVEAALCELQIAQGWVTDWDDLPAPPIEAKRRAQLEAGLEGLRARGRRRLRGFWVTLALVSLLIGGLVVLAAWPRPEPERDQIVEVLSQHAQAAAARFYFIYPPRDDPQGSTAYREVLAIEALPGDLAAERAQSLRAEFGATLVRLGDRYWEHEGARPFAYEYYASALIFVDHERARARVDLSVVALDQLRKKAASGDFNKHELAASEALAALAEPDPRLRDEKLSALRRAPSSLTVSESLDRLLSAEAGLRPGDSVEPGPRVDTGGDGSDGPDPDTGETDTDLGDTRTSETGDGPSQTEAGTDGALDMDPAPRREAEARALVAQAEVASKRGDLDAAERLFNRALAADRNNLSALDGLAAIAFSHARYEEAVKHLERAVKRGRRSSARWLALGDAYFKTLRYEDALGAYSRAEDLGSAAAAARITKIKSKLGED